ncbi:unnamed protein product, partial [Prorocentrum cordatum]
VQARATHIGAGCAELYFTEINITGTWARRHRMADLHWAAQDVERGRARWNKFHQIGVKVVHGHTLLGTRYLNVLVRGLNKAKFAIGGLLGEDDHTAAATPSAGCRNLRGKATTISSKRLAKLWFVIVVLLLPVFRPRPPAFATFTL